MALANYTDLKAAVAGWLMRSDLAAVVPDFIALGEALIKRRVRRKTIRATVSFTQEAVTLPAACAELRSVRLVTASPSQDCALDIVTPEVLSEMRARTGGAAGRPKWASVVNGALVLVPAPADAYQAELIYYEQITPLSATMATNSVLAEAPDLYLFAALAEAEPYLEHDERAPMWAQKRDQAIDQLNLAREREEYSASLRPVRLPFVI